MDLVVIGEAATKLVERHPDFSSAQPSIPRNSMRGMRNWLAHGYFDIDLDSVWDTLQHDLPALERQLKARLAARRTKRTPADQRTTNEARPGVNVPAAIRTATTGPACAAPA